LGHLGYISLNFISEPYWLKIKIGGDDTQIEKVSDFSPAAGLKRAASLIEKETLKKRILQRRINIE
jgi:hypothetical protein